MICLVIMAKNEANVIRRAVHSALPYVDCVFISDTGSSASQAAAMINVVHDECLRAGIEYKFDDVYWVDFATNRTGALNCAVEHYPKATHLLMLDADDYIESGNIGELDRKHSGFYVNVKSDGIEYPRVQIFSTAHTWRFRGVVHEYPEELGGGLKVGTVDLVVRSTREGARNQSSTKYQDDAALIVAALKGDIDDALRARYTFYLAQSYENAGDIAAAMVWYETRALIDCGYIEERYVALLRLARICIATKRAKPDEIVGMCLTAAKMCPHRREAVVLAMRELNGSKEYDAAHMLWQAFSSFGPVNGLFVEPSSYQWQMHEEAGVCLYYVGRYAESVRAFTVALKRASDINDRDRIARNMIWSLDRLLQRD